MPDLSLDEMLQAMKDHVNSMANKTPAEIYAVPPEQWEAVSSTYIENWPPALHQMSIPSYGFGLTNEMARAFGSMMGEYGGGFDISDLGPDKAKEMMISLANTIGGCIKSRCNGRAFVRLGSRSPKDCWIPPSAGDISKGIVKSGEEAMRRLTADSERLYTDLQTALAMSYQPWIWVREWVDMEPWQEFRCFMKDRKLIGISQYDYNLGRQEEIVENADGIEKAIKEFFQGFSEACHMDSVVFDVFLRPTDGGFEVKLLEINPFYWGTDPCLFTCLADAEENGGFRFCTEVKERDTRPDPDELLAELNAMP